MVLQRWSETYEGWLSPKAGKSPYEVLDDPVLIKKKADMREALREEYNKRWLNPYRQAAGIGGFPFDPMAVRYNALTRTQYQYFRAGPRFISATVLGILLPYGLLVYFQERERKHRSWKYRTGQVSFYDRPERNAFW